tara:strand:+ start:1839 stop:2030 length:192 start_codon:yes stop_codon:yes gene_type:complete
MTLLEKQLLMVQSLRESMPLEDRAYFYLSPVLNIKAHLRTMKDRVNVRRSSEEGFEENRKKTN